MSKKENTQSLKILKFVYPRFIGPFYRATSPSINYVCVLCLKLLTAECTILVTSRQVNLFNLVNTVELDQEMS